MTSHSMARSLIPPLPSAQTASKQSSGRTISTSTILLLCTLLTSFSSLLLLRREDVVAACFHCFLLVMSFTALLTESIPHIWTSFALHVIALVWSALQIWATQKFDVDYHLIITGPQGACPGIDLISGYFQERGAFQIATIVINFVSVIASGFLCWKLFGVSINCYYRPPGHRKTKYIYIRCMGGLHSRRWVLAGRLRARTSAHSRSLSASSSNSSISSPLLCASWTKSSRGSSGRTPRTEHHFSSATRSHPSASCHGCIW